MSDALTIDPDHPIYKLDPFKPRHLMIATLLSHGVCDERIAAHVDISEFAVKQYKRDPRTQQIIERLDEVKAEIDVVNEERFDALQFKAIAEMEKALDNEKLSPEAKLRLCKDILDRHPKGKFIKAQKNKTESSHSVTNEVINNLKRQSHMVAAEVIDITPVASPVPTTDTPRTSAGDRDPQHDLPHGDVT